jgi:hypothetical protein
MSSIVSPSLIPQAYPSADQSAQNETARQTLRKNLPNQSTQFATLEIEIKAAARGQEDQKPPCRWLFAFPLSAVEPAASQPAGLRLSAKFNRWTNLAISLLDGRI